MKTKKIFDVQNFDKKFKDMIFDRWRGNQNGYHIEFSVMYEEDAELSHYLISLGAKEGDEVLIKYWW